MSKVRIGDLSPDQLRAQIHTRRERIALLDWEIVKFSALPAGEMISNMMTFNPVSPQDAVKNLTRKKGVMERELEALTAMLDKNEADEARAETIAQCDQPDVPVVRVIGSHQITPERFARTVAREVGYAVAAGCDRGELARLLREAADRTEAENDPSGKADS
jgi:hypothetical protein